MTMPMHTIEADRITDAVARLCVDANRHIPPDMAEMMQRAAAKETSPLGRDVLELLQQNYAAAAETGLPMCQDTGAMVVMAEVGQDVHVLGDLEAAIHDGVRRATREGYLRASMLSHPLRRVNTGDNTPAIIHARVVPGNTLRLIVLPKGGGSENASALRMLTPSDGEEGVMAFVEERVSDYGANACPPLIIGVGVGSNFEGCALLAKQALLRPLGRPSADPDDARLEQTLLCRLNKLGIGPAGYGGLVTVLAVHVETAPCHIACLPCAVNIQCNAHRRAEITL